jgi:hypothetical protein
VGLGADFARALAAKDFERVTGLLHPEVDFVGLTPKRHWQASSPDEVVSDVLLEWFEESDHIEELLEFEEGQVGDRERVGYRFRLECPDGARVVEQQAYLAERDGRIGWMRVVCSGFRPLS